MAQVSLHGLRKRYGAVQAISDLSLDIRDREFFVLLGPTGAGKSTTLRCIAGLEQPEHGEIRIAGERINEWSAAQRDVALVFQQYSLYPNYTVRENLAFPLKSKLRHFTPQQIEERVAKAANTVRITHLLDRRTDRLSGGEMQRVSIGRAIVREPQAFLMDEPLSNLDAKLREALRAELKDLQMKLGATFLFVTHDQIEAMSMGDKIGVLNNGKIAQIGTPQEIYNSPRDTFVAGFVGSPAMNLVAGEVKNGGLAALGGKLTVARNDLAAAGNGAITLGVRSEDIRVGPGEPVAARIHHVENHGVEKIVTLRVDEYLIKATVPAALSVAIEDSVAFGLNLDKVHCFDGRSGVNVLAR